MKKIFIAVAFVTVFSACNNKAKEEAARQQAIVHVKDSLRLDSFKRAEAAALQAKKEQAERQRISTVRSSGGGTTTTNYGGSVQDQNTKKAGWSDAAKGATIGGLAGAVGGAIIDKKKGRGAIIGGVVGAGTGYVIGRSQDKKSGRVNN